MSEPIIVGVMIAAPIERVRSKFTDPDAVRAWNFATDEWSCPAATSDLRVGGAFSYRMAARDGSMAFDYDGTWEVVELERLVQVLRDGRRVEITFTAVEGGTQVTETFDPDADAPRELQRAGWQMILDRFAALAAEPAG